MSDEGLRRWTDVTERVLRRAGWHPGRSVPTDTWVNALSATDGFEANEAALRFLAEFGDLKVVRASDHERGWREFQLDPLLAVPDGEIFEDLSEQTGVPLFPLGMADHRNFYLGMAPDGSVHVGMDYASRLADSGDQALEKLIMGVA
ncbi:SUKH-3 domain-containing protein [Streptomyces sp. NPDC047123]|uniref:SUKH-3 domain-containing protein n=1 Tax=Streptomyces sp. NPDC047123 TaxID=3155622 RepID=UPI0034031D9D